jgi:hypothetical protein
MRKNHALNIIIHNADSNPDFRPDIVNEFHVQVIERRLNQLPLTTAQKVIVIDKIIESLKKREINGIIN